MKANRLAWRLAGGLCLVSLLPSFALTVVGQRFQLLATNLPTGGAIPENIVKGTDGNFYGTTTEGGLPFWTGPVLTLSAGTVFRVTPEGVFTTIAEFDGTAGGELYGGLIVGTDGSLYGMAINGGDLSVNNGLGYGTIFKLALDGSLTALVAFESSTGYDVFHRTSTGTLLQGKDGNLYGATPGNLVRDYGPVVPGTVFQATPGGALTTLVTFDGGNGSYPNGGLVQGSDGNFYGTTAAGGSSLQGPYFTYAGISGLGTVFRVTPDGVLTTLVRFNGSNGAYPLAGLIQANDGNFYGTTSYRGSSGGGTVFKMTPEGAFTTLASFVPPPDQPQYAAPTSGPHSRLVQGRDGNLYGTTQGWSTGGGTVFQLTPEGASTTLVSFDGTNAVGPAGEPALGDDGNLYGVVGGSAAGIFFRILVPSAPPVLNIALTATQFVLSWPTNAAGFTLQSSSDLSSSSNWANSTDAAAVVADQYVVTNNISASAQFYRLKQ